MTRYRKELNDTLVNLINGITPLLNRYDDITSGPQNEFTQNEAGKISDKIGELKTAAREEAVNARDGYIERLDAKINSFSGGTIDEGDIQIINSPIMVMTPDEYDLMCERYEGNRAMERLLIAYAVKHADTDHVYAQHFMTDAQKKDLCNSLCSECQGWISNGGTLGVRDYAVYGAGDMFNQADLLKE